MAMPTANFPDIFNGQTVSQKVLKDSSVSTAKYTFNTPVLVRCCCYQALATAGSILTNGYERLHKCQEAVSATRHTSADFHHELLRLRQHWRLKKVGGTIIGDLSYKSGANSSVYYLSTG